MSVFVVIPAAGHSRRMGRPKLLLPVCGVPVIQRLLTCLAQTEVLGTALVFRRADQQLAESVAGFDIIRVQPEPDPPDMRASVTAGLRAIQGSFHPEANDGWMLIPADHPVLNSAVISSLLTIWNQTDADVLIPVFEGQRGHPVIFRWALAERLPQLPPDAGINQLKRQPGVRVIEVPVNSDTILTDMDTPEDYARVLRATSQEQQQQQQQ